MPRFPACDQLAEQLGDDFDFVLGADRRERPGLGAQFVFRAVGLWPAWLLLASGDAENQRVEGDLEASSEPNRLGQRRADVAVLDLRQPDRLEPGGLGEPLLAQAQEASAFEKAASKADS